MANPGIFISVPQAMSKSEIAKFKRTLSRLALANGFAARRGKKRGSLFALLNALANGEVELKSK